VASDENIHCEKPLAALMPLVIVIPEPAFGKNTELLYMSKGLAMLTFVLAPNVEN
jgi:hypothetical protein